MKKHNHYWSKENCIREAKKHKSISSWRNKFGGSYNVAIKNNWIKECTKHMLICGNKFKRMIYAFEFPDNHVYIGLTYNLVKRKSQHLSRHNNSPVYKHLTKIKINPKLNSLTTYLSIDQAKIMEEYYLKKYKNENWIILNKAKSGSLGGNTVKHTKMACINNAKKYKTRSEWRKFSGSTYDSARRNFWLDECCQHMISLIKPNGYWTKEKCIDEAKKYNTRTDWQKSSRGSYGAAIKNKWFLLCTQHMKYNHLPNGYWTKERCIEDAKKYKTRNMWRLCSSSASTISSKNNWLDECCQHMSLKK